MSAPLPASAQLATPLVASLSLGLAPFFPEPHVVGKLRWVLGGATGMTAMDWGDFALHGAPWVWLGVTAVRVFVAQKKAKNA